MSRSYFKPLLISVLIHLLIFLLTTIVYKPKKFPTIVDGILADIVVQSNKNKRLSLVRRPILLPVELPNVSYMDNPTRKQLGFQSTESVNEISSVLPRHIVSDNISWSTISDIPLGTNQANTNTKISGQSSKLPEPVSENRKIQPLVPAFRRSQPYLSLGTSSTDLSLMTPADLALIKIAYHITRIETQKLDLVFVIDASQSMKNDIESVRLHLSRMTDYFEQKGLDFTVGVVAFRNNRGFSIIGWDLEITAQTRSVRKIEKVLGRIRCRGSEKAKDALIKAAEQVKFRTDASRRFILVTDEYASGQASAQKVMEILKQKQISVDVLGRDDHFQRTISQKSNGIWLPISSLRY